MRPAPASGAWVCTHCGNLEHMEREVACWKCGKGEMRCWPERPTEAKAVVRSFGDEPRPPPPPPTSVPGGGVTYRPPWAQLLVLAGRSAVQLASQPSHRHRPAWMPGGPSMAPGPTDCAQASSLPWWRPYKPDPEFEHPDLDLGFNGAYSPDRTFVSLVSLRKDLETRFPGTAAGTFRVSRTSCTLSAPHPRPTRPTASTRTSWRTTSGGQSFSRVTSTSTTRAPPRTRTSRSEP